MDETRNELIPVEHGHAAAGRGPDGRFDRGNPGKPKGARHRVTRMMELILEEEAGALARKAVELARAGEVAALRLCLERLAPPRRDAPVEFDLPEIAGAADTERASAALLAAIAAGEVTPGEAQPIMAMLVAHKGIVEAGDLERRLVAVEDGMAR
jgi:hypothetical protein